MIDTKEELKKRGKRNWVTLGKLWATRWTNEKGEDISRSEVEKEVFLLVVEL